MVDVSIWPKYNSKGNGPVQLNHTFNRRRKTSKEMNGLGCLKKNKCKFNIIILWFSIVSTVHSGAVNNTKLCTIGFLKLNNYTVFNFPYIFSSAGIEWLHCKYQSIRLKGKTMISFSLQFSDFTKPVSGPN